MPSSEAHHHTAQMVGVGARELKIVTQGASMGGFKVLSHVPQKHVPQGFPANPRFVFTGGGAPLSGITFMFLWDLLAEPWEAFWVHAWGSSWSKHDYSNHVFSSFVP